MVEGRWLRAILSLNSQLETLNSVAFGERGGKGTRTPDIQLAKLALYQLSYAPLRLIVEC